MLCILRMEIQQSSLVAKDQRTTRCVHVVCSAEAPSMMDTAASSALVECVLSLFMGEQHVSKVVRCRGVRTGRPIMAETTMVKTRLGQDRVTPVC